MKGVNVMKEKTTGERVKKVCKEISIKDIVKDCERTTLYPEVNCGQPENYTVCEDVPKGKIKVVETGKEKGE